jgi:hypothetical protein
MGGLILGIKPRLLRILEYDELIWSLEVVSGVP